ncbi:BamA/TamA family outer membrane protein [candidate division KSB1 bacterium]|nr:BamA/TamA family outer membrane protein [candidate division KSB1 bacterium]
MIKKLAVFLWSGLLFSAAFSQNESQPAHVLVLEDIEIIGNKKTNDHVILRHLSVQPGDTLGPGVLVVNKNRLDATKFFKSTDVYTKPGSEKGLVVLVVEIEERKWPAYYFKGGHGDLDGWYLIPVGFNFSNLFGHGQYLDFQMKWGNRQDGISVSYTQPDFLETASQLDISVFLNSVEFTHYWDFNDTAQTVQNVGLAFKLSNPFDIYKSLSLTGRQVGVQPVSNQVLKPYFGDDFNRAILTAIGFTFDTDTRDNPLFPASGFWGAFNAEIVYKHFSANYAFPKLTYDGRWFYRISERNVFAFHLESGYTTSQAPFYERFYLGGSYSLRGYSFARLTPLGWGSSLLAAQTELRFPLGSAEFPQYKHIIVLYYDVGGIWSPGELPGVMDFHHGLGVGYRIKLPIVNIARLDLTVPFSRIENDFFNYIKLQVALGHSF